MGNQVSPLLAFFASITGITTMFLLIQASYLVSQGNIQEATQAGLAAATLLFFLYGGAIVLAMGYIWPNFFPKVDEETFDISIGARDFVLGFLTFFLISKLSEQFAVFQFAILNVSEGFFAQASTVLGGFLGYYLVVLGAPVAEEFMFFIGLPALLYAFLRYLGKVNPFEFLENPLLQTGLIILIVAPIFASFHVSQQGLITFFISAFVFRGVLLMLSTDVRFENVIPFVTAGALFAIGGHIANNIVATGGIVVFINNMLFLSSNTFEFIAGLVSLIGLGLIFVVFIISLVRGRYFSSA